MNTPSKKRLIVNKISFIRNAGANGTGSFLINEGNNPMWLDVNFVKRIFSGLGLTTKTPFQKLLGTQISYMHIDEITEADLAAGGGSVKVISTIGDNREIEFKKARKNVVYDQLVTEIGASLRNSIDNAALDFDDSWAGDNTPAPVRQQTVQAPAPKVEEIEEEPAEAAELADETQP